MKCLSLSVPVPTLTLYTDASNLGWGVYLEGSWALGLWSPLQQKEHINLLEMKAVHLALCHFRGTLHLKSLVLATSLNRKLDTFVSPVPDSLAYAVDAMSISWKGMFAYAFSPFRFLSPSPSKGVSGILQDHSYCTGLAKTSLVHRSAASLLCKTTSSSSQSESTVSAERKNTASKSREPASARMVTLRKGIQQKGFSVRATNHISKAVQQSTEIVYAAKWSIFVDWCVGREIDPIKVSVQQLADFFVHLFEDKGLLPSTIKGYRSSITRTLTISGGTDFSNNEFLSLLIRNFDLERPKQKRLVPQWDLGLVLSALKLPPFEAATEVDLKFVSYKCCFLLALASGRKRSEIHALSVSDSCLRFNRDQPAVTLLTSFLGKNQIPCKSSEPIFIPALPSDSSSDLLCPIRILKIYLDRTRQKI